MVSNGIAHFRWRAARATSVAFINASTLKNPSTTPNPSMKDSDTNNANSMRSSNDYEPGSYRFTFLLAACKESRSRFHATPEYKKLREDMKGRKSSEIILAAKKLWKELLPERKFSQFDDKTIELLHERTKEIMLAKLQKLPRGVYLTRSGMLIVEANPEGDGERENRHKT
jgi:hypothetical protein